MATIRTTISVQDGLSQAFNRMTQSIQQTNQQYARIQQLVQQGLNDGSINNANNAQQRLNNSASQGVSIFDRMKNSVVAVGLAIGAAFSANKILETSDNLTQNIGRLNLVNDGLLTTEELQQRIFESAQRTGTAYIQVSNAVASFRQRAGATFKTNEEAIVFAELLNKSFSIANASQQEVYSATLQLTQALGAGALRGEELNAVLEAAPNIVQRIADELNVEFSSIKQLASDGVVTADIIRSALINSADDINAEFAALPFTSGALWQKVKNDALFAFSDILVGINATLNGQRFSEFATMISNSLYVIGNVASSVFGVLSTLGAFIYDNWAFIAPIFYGIATALSLMAIQWAVVTTATYAAAAAQYVFNAALNASPLRIVFLILGALVGLIYLAINVINHFAGTTVSAFGVIVGAVTSALAIVGNIFLGFYTFIVEVFKNIYNIVASFAEFFANVFDNPLRAAAQLFVGFANGVIGIVKSLAKAIDKVFGSNLASGLTNVQDKLSGFVDNKYGENSIKIKRFAEDDFSLDRYNIGQAYNYGYDIGSGISSKLSDSLTLGEFQNPAIDMLKGISSDIGSIKDSSGKTAQNTGVTKEDLKYLRDSTNANALNRFSGIQISVDMQNNNNINSALDLDGIVDSLAERLEETLYTTAEGL